MKELKNISFDNCPIRCYRNPNGSRDRSCFSNQKYCGSFVPENCSLFEEVSATEVKLKDISFKKCPFREKDKVYKNVGYCLLNLEFCDGYVVNNLPKECPLFKEVE